MEFNAQTIVVPAEGLERIPGVVEALYARARATVLARRQQVSALRGGYWVFHAPGGQQSLGFVPCLPYAHMILGRHSEADLRVDDTYHGFSLRQAMLRVRRDQEGELVLSVMDLESPQGMRLRDGRVVRALEGSGPFALHMGGLTMLFVPDDPGHELPTELPTPQFFGVQPRTQRPPPRQGLPLPQARALPAAIDAAASDMLDDLPRSLIFEREPAKPVGDHSFIPARPGPASHIEVDVHAAQARGASVFEVSTAEGSVGTLVLAAEDLEVGVLIGRYARCWSLGDITIPNEVSRVHALLMRCEGELVVFDLGSTNGVEVDGELVRAARLGRRQRVAISEELLLDVLLVGSAPTP